MVTRTVLDMTRLLPPYAWAVFFVVAMVCLFIGVQACAQTEQPGQPELPMQPEQQAPPMPQGKAIARTGWLAGANRFTRNVLHTARGSAGKPGRVAWLAQ